MTPERYEGGPQDSLNDECERLHIEQANARTTTMCSIGLGGAVATGMICFQDVPNDWKLTAAQILSILGVAGLVSGAAAWNTYKEARRTRARIAKIILNAPNADTRTTLRMHNLESLIDREAKKR